MERNASLPPPSCCRRLLRSRQDDTLHLPVARMPDVLQTNGCVVHSRICCTRRRTRAGRCRRRVNICYVQTVMRNALRATGGALYAYSPRRCSAFYLPGYRRRSLPLCQRTWRLGGGRTSHRYSTGRLSTTSTPCATLFPHLFMAPICAYTTAASCGLRLARSDSFRRCRLLPTTSHARSYSGCYTASTAAHTPLTRVRWDGCCARCAATQVAASRTRAAAAFARLRTTAAVVTALPG